MSLIETDSALIEKEDAGEGIGGRFSDLRSVKWRKDLGILPSSSSASIDELRRVTADSRRRYASLRKQILLDRHISKDRSNSQNLVIDNPLSQSPGSMWGHFFRNAELERMVNQDLSRLYPEHGSFFQTPGCQSMLRRVLLLWCLGHPQYGYRQGMHEVLAPLFYVLRADVEYLVEKFSDTLEDGNGSEKVTGKIQSPSDLDPKLQAVVLMSDAYGAEGELGTIFSEKFMEHDTYCMFDALMNGAAGAVAMAEFFSPPALVTSHSGFSPVLEASASLYHLLSLVDSSVHSHLVELGVESQYFALRWLRVLFGREFALDDLLTIWDEIFSYENIRFGSSPISDAVTSCAVLDSSRGTFISAFAVSMILYLRSSLLATENATSCLQRLLNFPEDVNLGKLVKKAKSLQALAMDANNSIPLLILAGLYDGSKSKLVRGHRHSHSLDLNSPRTPSSLVPDSYWEERWRDMHKEEESKQQGTAELVSNSKIDWPERVRMRLSRTESDPTPSMVDDMGKIPKSPVRKSLLNDQEDGSGRSSVASNSAVDENNASMKLHLRRVNSEGSPLPVSDNPEDISPESGNKGNSFKRSKRGTKEENLLSGKLMWLWKFGKQPVEGTSKKGGAFEAAKDSDVVCSQNISVVDSCGSERSNLSAGTRKGETIAQDTVTLRKLGQSIRKNIQVIESVFQQEKSQAGALESFLKNVRAGKDQVTALAALEELQKISNLLSEMDGDEQN